MPGEAVEVWPDQVHSTALMAATSMGSPTRSASSVLVVSLFVVSWPLQVRYEYSICIGECTYRVKVYE